MKTKKAEIVDYGRGPQIKGHRLTVMDVFYYLHRGRDFNYIHGALPSLERDEFDAVVEYVNLHRDELVEKDRRVEDFMQRGIEEQEAKGLYRDIDDAIPLEERAARLGLVRTTKDDVVWRLCQQRGYYQVFPAA